MKRLAHLVLSACMTLALIAGAGSILTGCAADTLSGPNVEAIASGDGEGGADHNNGATNGDGEGGADHNNGKYTSGDGEGGADHNNGKTSGDGESGSDHNNG